MNSPVITFVACLVATYGAISLAHYGFSNQADSEYWATLHGAGEEIAAKHAAERKALTEGRLPIQRAKELLAQRGRNGVPSLRPAPGVGAPPVAGWVHHPDYGQRMEMVRAAKARAAAAEAAVATEAADASGEATTTAPTGGSRPN